MKQQLDYLAEHRSAQAAQDYAEQTLRVYEACMQNKDHFCHIHPFRPHFVQALLELRNYLNHE